VSSSKDTETGTTIGSNEKETERGVEEMGTIIGSNEWEQKLKRRTT